MSLACAGALLYAGFEALFPEPGGRLHAFAARSADEVMPGQGHMVARMQAGVKMLQLHTYLAERGYECSFAPGAARALHARRVAWLLHSLHSSGEEEARAAPCCETF